MTATIRECVSCHTPLPEEAHFCFQCGAATPTEPELRPRTARTAVDELGRVTTAMAGLGYAVERIIGQGGMATVYLATDEKHRRRVALKVMRPELALSLGAERFLREVEIASQLNHPNILPVYDSGDADGVLYYVMPYIEGESLHDRIKRGSQLPLDEAIRIAREVSEALAYAHGKGIVHRDIKPANIMISAGHAMVADFGIARAVGASGGGLTRTGLAVGTPAYMSPEQATGSEVDGRSDIYAVASMLYEMLAGEPPFNGPTAQVILTRSLTETHRPLGASREGISSALETAVGRALAKNPADRWHTAAEFAHALDTAETEARFGPVSGARTPVTVPVVTTGGNRARRWSIVGIAAAVALVLGYGVVQRVRASTASSVVRVAVLPFENRGATDDGYFVDGMADQVRGKLMGVAGFRVIARASSEQYRGSKKSPQEIGKELGVDYLLSSTVTWAKSADGKGRVRVAPELINVKTGALTWQQSFDAELTDIFQVQGSIATEVAGALDVALAPKEQATLAARPTTSLEAYDQFLKGNAVTGGSPAEIRTSVGFYQRAVALDPGFADAWSRMARGLARLYFNGTPTPEVAAEARRAVEQLATVAPGSSLALAASSSYKYFVLNDPAGAIVDGRAALQLAPNDANILRLAAQLESIVGRWT